MVIPIAITQRYTTAAKESSKQAIAELLIL